MRCAFFLLSLALSGQPPGEAELLARIRLKVKENLARLPNYTCIETVERSTRPKPTGKFATSDTVRFEVAYVDGHELYGWPGAAKIDEPDITKLVSGAIGNGDFAIFPKAVLFTPSTKIDFAGETDLDGKHAIKYQFAVPPEAKAFRIQTGGGNALVGFHGWFWVDFITLDLIRIQSVADDIPRTLGLASSTTILNFGPSTIGSSEFLLPQSSDLVMTRLDGGENRNRTIFHGCRQFSGVSTIKFDVATVEPAANIPGRAVTAVNLPMEFEVEIRLVDPIDSATAAIGDSVRATLRQNIKLGHDVVVPKGAEVSCRIAFLEKHGYAYIMALEAASIDFEGGHAGLTGRQNKVVSSLQRNRRMFNPAFVYRQGPQVFLTDHLQIPRGAGFVLFSRLLKSKDNDSIRP